MRLGTLTSLWHQRFDVNTEPDTFWHDGQWHTTLIIGAPVTV